MKLATRSIPYRTAESVRAVVVLVALAVVTSAVAVRRPVGLAVLGAFVIVAAGVAAAWQAACVRRVEYDASGDAFEVRRGVFSRRRREIPVDRLQHVDVARNAVHRLLGIAEVRLTAAGADETEVRLRFVTEEEASRLRDRLRSRPRATDELAADAPQSGSETETTDRCRDSPDGDPLFSLSARELGLLACLSIDLRLASLFSLGLAAVAPSLADRLLLPEPAVVRGPLAVAAVYVAATVGGGLVAVVAHHGFRLSRDGDDLRYACGLATRRTGTVPLSSVQSVTRSSNPLWRLAGYARVRVATAGGSRVEPGDSALTVPIVGADRARDLVARIAPGAGAVAGSGIEHPPKRARRRYAVRYLLALVPAAAVLVGVGSRQPSLAPLRYLGVALPALAPVAGHCAWRSRGYALTPSHVVVREGFWRRRTTVVPRDRVQAVIHAQSPFQRRRGLASVRVATAGDVARDPCATDLDADDAARLREAVSAPGTPVRTPDRGAA